MITPVCTHELFWVRMTGKKISHIPAALPVSTDFYLDAGEIMMTEAPPWKKLKLGSHQNPDYDMQEFSGTAKVFLKRTLLCKGNKSVNLQIPVF